MAGYAHGERVHSRKMAAKTYVAILCSWETLSGEEVGWEATCNLIAQLS